MEKAQLIQTAAIFQQVGADRDIPGWTSVNFLLAHLDVQAQVETDSGAAGEMLSLLERAGAKRVGALRGGGGAASRTVRPLTDQVERLTMEFQEGSVLRKSQEQYLQMTTPSQHAAAE